MLDDRDNFRTESKSSHSATITRLVKYKTAISLCPHSYVNSKNTVKR